MLEGLSKRRKLDEAKKLFAEAVDRDAKWQIEAREDFAFRDGDQWTEAEKGILDVERRPALTFNLTKSSIDLIMGMNEDNKIRYRATPVEPTDGFLCEVLNDLVDHVAEVKDFEQEEDGALESAAICGRGFVGIDFMADPDRFGDIIMTEVDIPVHEVHFDPAARRANLEDASYIVWDRWMSKEDFKMRFPKLSGNKIDILMQTGRNYGLTSSDAGDGLTAQVLFEYTVGEDEVEGDYSRPLDLTFFDRAKNMIRVVHMEYFQNFRRYFAFDPELGEFVELPKRPSRAVKEAFFAEFGEEMTVEWMVDKRTMWLQFIGEEILYDDVSPLPYKGFSIKPTLAYRDVSKRTMNHFGLVKLMKDPQQEVNKRWSQALNMLNQQVQPGVYAETDAFVDQNQAEQSMKEAGAITWTQAGALTGNKIKERTVPTFPNAPMQMEQFSQDIMKKITGINPDLLGQDRGRQEPGVVVRLRQQQGMTLLKPLFRNFNAMKKGLFKRQLAIIMAYMPNRQIKRILGENERYRIDSDQGIIIDTLSIDPKTGIPSRVASIRNIRDLDFNVRSETAPGNLTKRMLELTVMLEMQKNFPVPPEQIIEKLDIAETEKAQWLEYIKGQQAMAMQEKQKMLQLEAGFKDREIKVDEQKNILDFLIDMTKIKQMAEKDEKKLVSDFKKLSLDAQEAILKFTAQVADTAQKDNAAKLQAAVAVKTASEAAKTKKAEGSKKK
jgi:hypothetical protein